MKTKKLFASLLAGAFLCFCSASYAQYHSGGSSSGDGAWDQGVNQLGVGVGFGGGIASYSYAGGWSSSSSPGYMLTFEHGINEHWGIGAAFTYASTTETSPSYTDYNPNPPYQLVSYTDNWKFTAIGFIIRGAYHFTVNSKFDPYVGIGLGYFDFSSKYTTGDPYYASNPFYVEPTVSLGGVAFTAYAGARYYIAGNLGIWAELGYTGYAGNLINLGLNFKF